MRVTFVRHGESQSNANGRWQGQGDSPLSELGRAQAQKAADRLPRHRFSRVVSSDLSRARDTARAIGVEPELDPGMREIHVGAWEGLGRNEVLERFPDEIAALVRGEDVRIGGGESWREATDRALASLRAQLAHHGPGDELAIFSHGGVITSIFLELTGAKTRRPQPLGHMVNTAISIARFDESGAIIERYNDANHVPETAAWRRRMFGTDDTLIGVLVADETSDVESWLSHRKVFDEVDAVVSSDVRLNAIATVLSERLSVPFEVQTSGLDTDLIASRHPGKRIIAISSGKAADEAVATAIRPMIPEARFDQLTADSLTHIVRTRSTILLADFASRLGHL